MADKEIPSIHIDESFPCPFCKGTFGLATAASVVTHSLPMCSTFDHMTGDQFLKAAREKVESKVAKA